MLTFSHCGFSFSLFLIFPQKWAKVDTIPVFLTIPIGEKEGEFWGIVCFSGCVMFI